jgi:hypothetical protein
MMDHFVKIAVVGGIVKSKPSVLTGIKYILCKQVLCMNESRSKENEFVADWSNLAISIIRRSHPVNVTGPTVDSDNGEVFVEHGGEICAAQQCEAESSQSCVDDKELAAEIGDQVFETTIDFGKLVFGGTTYIRRNQHWCPLK